MTPILPPASLWEQYSVIGILVLILTIIGIGARRLFKDFIAWQAEQDKKRDDERERQRLWQEAMEQKAELARVDRDVSWQTFFERINGENSRSINRLAEVHAELVKRMDALTRFITEHDDWAHRIAEENGIATKRQKSGTKPVAPK